ncbi:MAG: phenylalanine--tRNA ligase subunit beta [Sandaracinaceae bacterium]|nr:phenylalanine--tRNA ligase subunit beta [Sandaracinaceae bacterium]
MLASYEWLKALSGVDISAEEMAQKLTSGGLEVESLTRKGEGLDHVVVAEVRAIRPHPAREKLRLVTVFDGQGEQEVVCGAANVPAPGGRVILAKLGAVLPGDFVIAERELGGIVSCGMLCSEGELQIGPGGEGIYVFPADADAAPGTPVADALGLRDVIFEIGLTPNRPDCLGHIGLAREVALAAGAPFVAPVAPAPRAGVVRAASACFDVADDARFELSFAAATVVSEPDGGGTDAGSGAAPVRITIEDAERCPRYGAALVRGVSVAPSPFWLRYRLQNLGVRAISNLVDATNLVMLEHGHPIHGFDLGRVRGSHIIVRGAHAGEQMHTLDGVQHTLAEGDLLICDDERPVALAGVMGGLDSEIQDDTRDVLIECAYFQPQCVRRTSRRVGLHTDASHRFERGVDRRAVRRVLARAAQLIADLGGGVAYAAAAEVVASDVPAARIPLRTDALEALLGVAIPREVAERVLRGIGCDPLEATADGFVVDAPTFRPDLGREVDLIEEVARIHGFDRIPARTPRVRPSEIGTPPAVTFRRRALLAGTAAGMHQAINYRFLAPPDLARARVATDAVPLANPLSEERSVMRTSLLPSLLMAAGAAQRHQARSIALFEVGRSFHPRDAANGAAAEDGDALLPVEREWLSVLLLGASDAWLGDERAYDFYDLKGRVEAVVHTLIGLGPELRADGGLDVRAPSLHPRRRAVVSVAGVDVGVLGEVHPEVVDAFELDGRPLYAELDMAALGEAAVAAGVPQAGELPRYPAATRDVALLLADEHAAGTVAAAMEAEGAPLAESVRVFDVYRGEQIPAGHRSVAFRITYRDAAGTLKDKDVDSTHARVVKVVSQRFAAQQR